MVCTLIAEFLDHGRQHKAYSVHTLKGYRSALNGFATWAVPTPLVQVTAAGVTAYDDSTRRSLRPRTRARNICAIRSFYRWLVEDRGLIEVNPAAKVRQPAADESSRSCPEAATRRRLIEATGRLRSRRRCVLTRAALGAMLHAGLRPGEVCALDLDDVALRDVRPYLIVQAGKGRKRREVPLSDDLVCWLREWLTIRPGDTSAFFVYDEAGCHRISLHVLRVLLREVKAIAAVHDDGLTPHSLRHGCATALYEAGVELPVIQEILGHSSIITTRHYVHVDAGSKFAAVQRLNAAAVPQRPKVKPFRMLKRQR